MPDRVQESRELMRSIPEVTYLQHESTNINLPAQAGRPAVSLKIFGSPFSPAHDELKQNWAFQYPASDADGLWNAIPEGTDIVITHTPPKGHCDESHHWPQGGCAALTRRPREVKPTLHVCGHCHEGRGAQIVDSEGEGPGSDGGVWKWEDGSVGTKKQALLDLTGRTKGPGGRSLTLGTETAVVNCAIMAKSHGREGKKEFNKPIVVDLPLPLSVEQEI